MNIIISVVFSLWFLRILTNILSYAYLWFVKEYRWDRMFIHLKTKQGHTILFPSFRRPPISPKTIMLTLLLFIFSLWVLLFWPFPIILKFIIADLLLFPISFVLVGILKLPTLIYHRYKISKAITLLNQHPPMTVIGVTGSYGKTSTKEYLATILSSKYKVLKTEASKNAAIGIAEIVLSHLRPEQEVFIVEMGAYKRGEIKEMTEMVKPEIGIITAINPQHQDLFGSMETTMKAKYELIAGLSGKKIAIFNADNDYVQKMAHWAIKDKKRVWSFSADKKRIVGAEKSFEASEVTGDLAGLSFAVSDGKTKERIHAKVLGEHQASLIAGAIAGSVAARMSFAATAKAARLIKPISKTLSLIPGINGSNYIDDTFNNNPDAAIAALDFLAKTKGQKILVFQPMIELGSFAQVSHELVGEHAAKVCDEIILTNNNFYDFFVNGVKKINSPKLVKVMSSNKTAEYLQRVVRKGDTVLFKGKEAEQVLKRLIEY